MEKSENLDALFADFAKAQRAITKPEKSGVNAAFARGGSKGFSYSTLADLQEVLYKIFKETPLLSFTQFATTSVEGGVPGVFIHSMLLHASGQYLKFDPFFMPAKDASPHSIAGAITYGKRYSITSIFCLGGEPDDDGNSAGGIKESKATEVEKKVVPLDITEEDKELLEDFFKKNPKHEKKICEFFEVKDLSSATLEQKNKILNYVKKTLTICGGAR